MSDPIAWYREFAPCTALQDDVYALFSSVPGPRLGLFHRPLLQQVAFRDAIFCAPQFADGHVSIAFALGRTCQPDTGWHEDSATLRCSVIGPMTVVGRTEGNDLPEMVGVYFQPGRANAFFRLPMSQLTDRAVALENVWGASAVLLLGELCELDEESRIDRLESALLARLALHRRPPHTLNVDGLAASVLRRRGQMTVDAMAHAAGVSRQYLARQFRERIGVGPKLYSRLVRFHAGLAYAGSRAPVDWARVSVDMGYADQSHMIAEFRQFSGLTPNALATGRWFHPFIERARRRREHWPANSESATS